MANGIIDIIMNYGDEFDPSEDINYAEAMNIIEASHSKMEIVEHSFLYGHMRGSHSNGLTRPVPLYNLPQLTDEEWSRLSKRNKAEREVVV